MLLPLLLVISVAVADNSHQLCSMLPVSLHLVCFQH